MTAATGTPTPRDAVWEPYQLAVGQRVRIRLSGECPYCTEDGASNQEDGLIGFVLEIEGVTRSFPRIADANWRSHRYLVGFAQGVHPDGFDFFAAAELVPLADHDRASEAAGEGG